MRRELAYPEFADPMVRPRYTGIPRFMRAPYREVLAGIDIGLIGVPFDGGVTNRTGARHGPREIRNQSSLMRRVNQATRIDPYALCRIADLGDAWVEKPFELQGAHRESKSVFAAVHGAGVVPVSAGADRSISPPRCRAPPQNPPHAPGPLLSSLPYATHATTRA